MILPVTIYGNPILRKKAVDIDKDYEGLEQLIDNMWDTMYKSDGVGLAAPQINKSIRLIVIDATPFGEDDESVKDFKKVFINLEIIDFRGEKLSFNEGCLSLPTIREDVERPTAITIKYQDEEFNTYEEEMDGIKARIVQHEYDHLQGKLFIDHVSPIRRRLLGGKLNAIAKGKIVPEYKVVRNK